MNWFAEALEHERNMRRLTPSEFAEFLGLDAGYISRWRHGAGASPENIQRVADKLGWNLRRIRSDYNPADDVLASNPAINYRPDSPVARQALAHALAAARRDGAEAGLPPPINRYNVNAEAVLDPMPSAAFCGLDDALGAYPLARLTDPPTRLLYRAEVDDLGCRWEETHVVRTRRHDTPIYARQQVVVTHPNTRKEILCEIRILQPPQPAGRRQSRDAAAISWIVIPLDLDRSAEAWPLDASAITGVCVAWFSSPPCPVDLADAANAAPNTRPPR